MKIGVLTSSRADYGIYKPLLTRLKADDYFKLEIIAFGTHTSNFHGHTIDEIIKDDYHLVHQISCLLLNDAEVSIATAYGLTCLKFAEFWNNNKYDLVLCLGDRYEMSAAVQASIPFGIKLAHLHGGENTLGAIDNIYRHQITLASSIHFTAANEASAKVIELKGNPTNVYTVGSISLDELEQFVPKVKDVFFNQYNIPSQEFALVTFHPETVSPGMNNTYAEEMLNALNTIAKTICLVITMPNADTQGTVFRKRLHQLKEMNNHKVILVENFGKANYFSAIYYSKLLIGNSSSGILEAASFKKFVVNVGDRQKGRLQSNNILNAAFKAESIIAGFHEALKKGDYNGENVYYKNGAVKSDN